MEYDFQKYEEVAELLKILAHPARLCIVKGLIEKGQCNVGYMHSCMKLPQSTVSQHLQKLKAAGVIKGIRNGLEINYMISDERVTDLIKLFFNKEA